MQSLFTSNNLKKAIKKPKIAMGYLWGKIAYNLWLPIPASQFGEDLILNYLIRKENWFYVDIGANDPFFWSNSYLFYNKGWSWITVEPNKQLHKKIQKKRARGINLNVAVGKSGLLSYYEIDSNGMSTCDKDLADYYVSKGHTITNIYETPIVPLSEIFDSYLGWNTIDVLSIDVEWMDMEVLLSNNWEKYKPLYIVLETLIYKWDDEVGARDDKRFTEYLEQYWYTVVADTFINTIYRLTN